MTAECASAARTLRLVWPQWQGAQAATVAELAPEFPVPVARRGYVMGTAVLQAVLPPHDGPTAIVPVPMDDGGLEERDGIEAKQAILTQLKAALDLIAAHDAGRILTLGGDCSVSVAPFAALADRYPDELAIVWIDSHPDADTNETGYSGYHAMAVSALTGHGDGDVQALLPATVPAERVALTGLHSWAEDVSGHLADWGLVSFAPDDLRTSSRPLLDWLVATGCAKVAIHFDVDTIDSDEVVLGLGAEPGGLTSAQVRRIVADLQDAADVVGLTIAEYIPRQAMRLAQLVDGFPLT
jgi:arginase